jgi:streptogramin lyase
MRCRSVFRLIWPHVFSLIAIVLVFTAHLRIASAGLIYVGLNSSNKVVTFDTSSNNAATIQATQTDFITSGINFPRGMVKSGDSIYVANELGLNMKKYDLAGNLQQTYTMPSGFTQQRFAGLGVHVSGSVYGAAFNGKIIKFNSNGTLGTPSEISPTGGWTSVAVSSTNEIYVSNFGTGQVIAFDNSGTELRRFTGGTGPEAIAFDAADRLYVSSGSSTINVFSATGTSLGSFSSGVSGIRGLAFDDDGYLYATGKDSNTISKIDSSGTILATFSTSGGSPLGIATGSFSGGGSSGGGGAAAVPEPGSVLLMIGIFGAGAAQRWRKRRGNMVADSQ